MILDTSRDRMPAFPDTVRDYILIRKAIWKIQVLADPEAAKYVDGIGIHWYADGNVNTSVLDTTHTNHPDKFMLYTEVNKAIQFVRGFILLLKLEVEN